MNIALVLVLAGTGTLKTAKTGDVERVSSTTLDSGRVELPEGASQYVIENPTDVDFFYNIVVHVKNGGFLYPGNGEDPHVQLKYVYAPALFFLYVPLYYFGYFGFKIGWLILELLMVGIGTYLVIDVESNHRGYDVAPVIAGALAIAALGFQPMVANFKTGQSAPIMYFSLALMWWFLRRGLPVAGGGILTIATLVKPYLGALIVVTSRERDLRGALGFFITFLALNLFAIVAFDLYTVLTYYGILTTYLSEESAPVILSFETWSSSDWIPFYWLGHIATYVRFAFAIPAMYLAIRYFFGYDDDPLLLFVVGILSTVLVFREANAIDLGILLLVIVLLGFRYYETNSNGLLGVLVALLLLQGHAYVMELLVGWGSENLELIASNEQLVFALLPMLQPATYAVLLLYGLSLKSWWDWQYRFEPTTESIDSWEG